MAKLFGRFPRSVDDWQRQGQWPQSVEDLDSSQAKSDQRADGRSRQNLLRDAVSLQVAHRTVRIHVLFESEFQLLVDGGANVSLAIATACLGAAVATVTTLLSVKVSPTASAILISMLVVMLFLGGASGLRARQIHVKRRREVDRILRGDEVDSKT